MSSDTPAGQFRRHLGLFDATMLVAGSMIGSGIFIVSADISRDVGSAGWLLAVWLVAGVLTIIGALCYAELASLMPHAGGQYVYLREAYGPLWGFLYGWTCFLVIETGFIAAVSVAFAKYLGVIYPQLGADAILWRSDPLNIHLKLPVPWMNDSLTFFKRDDFTVSAGQLVAVGVVIALTFINCRGVREGKWVQNLFTVAKTLALVMLIVVGLTFAYDADSVRSNFAEPWSGIHETATMKHTLTMAPISTLALILVLSAAMVGALFSADAWNNVTFIAGEIKSPERNLPRSLALGTGSVILLYLLANVTYLAVLPIQPEKDLAAQLKLLDDEAKEFESAGKVEKAKAIRATRAKILQDAPSRDRGIALAKDDRVATAVLQGVSPNLGVPLMAIAIMISTVGCTNGIILTGARLSWAMANDKLFFRSVGRLNARGVPAAGLILQAGWSILLIFSGSYSELLDFIIFAALFFYVLTIGSVFVFRRTRPDEPRPYRAIGYPLIPLLYMLTCGVIMLSLLFIKPVYSWPSFLIVLTGIPVYYLWRKSTS